MGVSCMCFDCVCLVSGITSQRQANLFVLAENIGKLNCRPDSGVRVIN